MKRVKHRSCPTLIRPSKYTCINPNHKLLYGIDFGIYMNHNTNEINLFRYLVPNDLSAYHFNYIIRKRIKLPETGSLYFFVNGRYLLKGDTLMSDVYNQRKDADGFLYITYTDETTLGAMQ